MSATRFALQIRIGRFPPLLGRPLQSGNAPKNHILGGLQSAGAGVDVAAEITGAGHAH